jgi:hypothetical protein
MLKDAVECCGMLMISKKKKGKCKERKKAVFQVKEKAKERVIE